MPLKQRLLQDLVVTYNLLINKAKAGKRNKAFKYLKNMEIILLRVCDAHYD